MKKRRRIKGFAVLLLFLLTICSTTAFAAEGGSETDSQLILTTSVSGYPADVDNGKAETILPDGTEVTVEGGDLPDGLLLVVEPLEGDILAWIEKCLEGKGTNIRAYDIYFLDKDGNVYKITAPITLSFRLNGEYQHPAVYYISEAGETEKMPGSVSGDQISFTTDHNSYYALVEQAETDETGDSGKPSGSSDGNELQPGSNTSGATSGTDSPKTGDDTASGFWTGIMLISLFLAVCSLFAYRKKRA